MGDFGDGIDTDLPSFESHGGGEILRAAIITIRKIAGYNETVCLA